MTTTVLDLLPFYVTLTTLGTRERVTVQWEFPVYYDDGDLALSVSTTVDITSWS